jgi:hypothetical protein
MSRLASRTVLVACFAGALASSPCPAAAGQLTNLAVLAKPKPPLEGKKSVAVGTIAGKHAGKTRALLFERLKESNAYEVADTEDLKPGDNKATIAKAAKALSVNGVVMGRVSDKYDLTLVVYNADGKLVKEVTIKGGTPQKLEAAIKGQFNNKAGPPLALATGGKNLAEVKAAGTEVVEEEEEDEPGAEQKEEKKEEEAKPEQEKEDEKPKEKEDDEKSSEPSKPGKTPLEITAGIRGYNRQFKYTDPVTKLLPYSLAFGPALLIGGRIYPAAFFRDDFSGNIGLIAQGELGIATSTDYKVAAASGGSYVQKLKTSAQEWSVGLVGRLPIAPAEIDVFGVYGTQTFILKGDEGGSGLAPLVPDVKYQYIRPGVEARARVSKFFLGGHVAPRFLLSLHNIDLENVWFPGATGTGLDFGLKFGYGLLPFLDAVAGFDYVRYGFDFNGIPKGQPTCATTADPNCQKVAGGASDTYISGWLGMMFHLANDAEKK